MKKRPHVHIWVQTPKQLSRIKIESILYCHCCQGKATIVQKEKPEMPTSESLTDIEKRLPARNFFRCHRAYVVNLEHVEHFIEKSMEAVVGDKIKIPISRNRKEKFLSRLADL